MDAETIKIIIALFTLFIGTLTFSFGINKYVFGKQLDAVLSQIAKDEKDNKDEHKRIEDERKSCREHCEGCRNLCQANNKVDIQHLHERIDNAG
jgi:hypothetical protein